MMCNDVVTMFVAQAARAPNHKNGGGVHCCMQTLVQTAAWLFSSVDLVPIPHNPPKFTMLLDMQGFLSFLSASHGKIG